MEINNISQAISKANIRPDVNGREDPKLKEACDQFEGMFLSMMMQQMRKTVQESELFHGGKGEEMFRDLQDMAIAKEAGRGNGSGMSSLLYGQLYRESINFEENTADKS